MRRLLTIGNILLVKQRNLKTTKLLTRKETLKTIIMLLQRVKVNTQMY